MGMWGAKIEGRALEKGAGLGSPEWGISLLKQKSCSIFPKREAVKSREETRRGLLEALFAVLEKGETSSVCVAETKVLP